MFSFVFKGSIPLSTTKKCVRTLAHFFFCLNGDTPAVSKNRRLRGGFAPTS